MPLVWLVECKVCAQRFPALPRERTLEKSTSALEPHAAAGRFECPHCHEFADYRSDDLIPGDAKAIPPSSPE